MNILNVGQPYFSRAFRESGHQVLDIRGFSQTKEPWFPNELFAMLAEKDFAPDLALWCDGSDLPNVFGLELLPCVTIGYSIDLYCNPWHIPYSATFDHFLVAQKDFVPLVAKDPFARPVEWFPLFAKYADLQDLGLERDIPVSFIGTIDSPNIPTRRPFFEALRKHIPIYLKQGRYQEIFNRSQIVLNQSAVGEVNFRTFEAAACGAAVFTEDTAHGLSELFIPDKEILTYPPRKPELAAALARQWLDKPEELARIAAAGRQRVLQEHTVYLRAQRILEIARDLQQRNAQKWRLEHTPRMHFELEKAFAFITAEIDTQRFPELRQLFYALSQRYATSWKHLAKSRL